jgi:hypothetical protein
MSVPATSPEPVDPADRVPLSLAQEFLSVFDKGDAEGSFAERHTLVYGWRVRGGIDVDVLRTALDDVVERHETLRTSVVLAEGDRHQRIHPPSPARVLVHDLSGTAPDARDVRAEEFVNEIDAAPFPVGEIPHVRVHLGRFTDDDTVLVVATHHIATDAWSLELILRDLAAFHAARTGFGSHGLPDVRHYREYADWQGATLATSAAVTMASAYWREKLRGARILAVPLDRHRTAGVPNSYAVHRFVLDAELGTATVALSKALRSSPFIVLLATWTLLLSRVTGATDVVVPTFTSGRDNEDFLDTVGPFFNFVPLRTDLDGCASFRDLVTRARTTCLEAYSNDIPFPLIANEAPELMAPLAQEGVAVVAFEILQSPSSKEDELVGNLRYTEIRRRVLSQEICSHIPDGGLWAMDVLPSGEIAGSLKFDSNLFDESTMVGLVSEFSRLLRAAVSAPDTLPRQLQAADTRDTGAAQR